MTDGPAETVTDPADDRASLVEQLPARRRLALGAIGVVFWLWLFARWAYHNAVLDAVVTAVGFPDLVHSEIAIRAREGWVPAAPFEAVADTIAGVADPLGPASVLLDWAVWLADLTAFATTIAPALAEGAFVTVYLTVLSILFGLVVAVPIAVARTFGGALLQVIALAYTELVRGTPLLAQLFFVYFALPLTDVARWIGFTGEPPVPQAAAAVAVLGFTINSSAYQAEYIRSALESVDAGQMTAARAVGLSKRDAIRHVVLPQGLRLAIPSWTNEFVYLIKYSSLAAFITVPELFQRAMDIASDTFQYTDIYVVVGLFYLALVLTTALAMSRFETAVSIPGLGRSVARD